MLIDLPPTFGSTNLIGVDGLHPVEPGDDRLAARVLDALRERFERPPDLH